jgi:hypothetical protein
MAALKVNRRQVPEAHESQNAAFSSDKEQDQPPNFITNSTDLSLSKRSPDLPTAFKQTANQ